MPVSSATEHWIRQDALTINLNHFGDPDYLQVSVLAGAVVMAFKQDVIGYNAAHNYRTWPLDAANTYLETSSAYHVYAKLTRSEVNARALIAYDPVLRDIEGREITYAEDGSEVLGEPDTDLYYILLGKITSSIDANGNSINREWEISFRFGNLNTNQFQNEEAGGEWTKMFRLNKVTDMIDVLKDLSFALFKKLSIKKGETEKIITDIKRSFDNDEDVPVNDETIPTSQYLKSITEAKFIRRDKDDRSIGKIASDKGFEVGKFTEGDSGGAFMIDPSTSEATMEADNSIVRKKIELGEYVTGASGAIIHVDKNTGHTIAELDKLYIRMKAYFETLEIINVNSVGGKMILSPAGAVTCIGVEETNDAYRCYFLGEQDGEVIENRFESGDQAYSEMFNAQTGVTNKVSNHYYWRLVTGASEDVVYYNNQKCHYIELSKTDCDTNSYVPKAGDVINHRGSRTDTDRMNFIEFSSVGVNAPYITLFQGVGGTAPYYSLTDKEYVSYGYDQSTGKAYMNVYGDMYVGDRNGTSYMRYTQEGGLEIKGELSVGTTLGGKDLQELVKGLEDNMENLEYGKNNILLNSGFMGDFVTASLAGDSVLGGESKMFSPSLKYWTSNNVSVRESEVSESKMEAVFGDEGSIEQTLAVNIIPSERYIFSFRGKGGTITMTLGDVKESFTLTEEWSMYMVKFVASKATSFRLESKGESIVCELQLERGTIRSSWGMSPLDNRSELAKYETLTYLLHLLQAATTIIGGVVNTGYINMGNLDSDGNLSETTAGISGVYNNESSVAYFAGGDLEKAIYTVSTYLDNPEYTPTQEELGNMAKYVVTHGGRAILNDVILRGYIYALGGKFKGEIEALKGKFKNITTPDGSFLIDDNGTAHIGGFRVKGLGLTNQAVDSTYLNGTFLTFRNTNTGTEVSLGSSAVQSSTGRSAAGRLGNEKEKINERDVTDNTSLIVSAKGAFDNVALDIDGGCIRGLAVSNSIISTSDTTYYITKGETNILALNTSDCDVYLPQLGLENDGYKIRLKRMGSGGVYIKMRACLTVDKNAFEIRDYSYPVIMYGRGQYQVSNTTPISLGDVGDCSEFIWVRDIKTTISGSDYYGAWIQYRMPGA